MPSLPCFGTCMHMAPRLIYKDHLANLGEMEEPHSKIALLLEALLCMQGAERGLRSRAPRRGSGPKCAWTVPSCLGGTRTLPSSHGTSLPTLPPPLSPTPPDCFCDAPEDGGLGWRGGGILGRQLRPDPHLRVLNQESYKPLAGGFSSKGSLRGQLWKQLASP